MLGLIITSVIWAFSFPFIGHYLAGQIPSDFIVVMRFLPAFIVSLFVFNFQNFLSRKNLFIYLAGLIEVGIMYFFYLGSFAYLNVSEVALFTVFTPVHVYILSNIIDGKSLLNIKAIVSITVCLIGSIIVKITHFGEGFWLGFAMVQGANFSFALGQVLFRKLNSSSDNKKIKFNQFALFYLGALTLAAFGLLKKVILGEVLLPNEVTITQWCVLAWLSLGASLIGYFLWNSNTSKVCSSTLANCNNLVIPMAILVNALFFTRTFPSFTFFLGAILIALGVAMSEIFVKDSPS